MTGVDSAERTPGRSAVSRLPRPRSGIGVGLAVGAAAVGFIIDGHGPRAGYVFAAACGVASAVTCLLGLGRLRSPASLSRR